eukprot:3998604-Pleurochrysis_carterae.AAC.1
MHAGRGCRGGHDVNVVVRPRGVYSQTARTRRVCRRVRNVSEASSDFSFAKPPRALEGERKALSARRRWRYRRSGIQWTTIATAQESELAHE